MATWFIKSDPDEYSAADLARDGTTTWDGIRSAPAQLHLRAMKKNDKLFVYHSGKDKAIIATATVAAAPQSDPEDRLGKRVAAKITFDRLLKKPVALAQIKADSRFADFALVRISRLSVMPVSDDESAAIRELCGGFSTHPPKE
ncbi:MAG: EVE domain-containing protein [Phycisphaerae bacterium]